VLCGPGRKEKSGVKGKRKKTSGGRQVVVLREFSLPSMIVCFVVP